MSTSRLKLYLTFLQLLIESGSPNVILIRESSSTRKAIGQFDYDDLNAYLLLVTGLARPQDSDFDQVDKIVSRARTNQPVELGHVKSLLGRKETPAFCDASATLARAVEIFGGGCHRIIVRAPGSEDVVGILSQLRLVRFLWENRASFQPVEQLHNRSLKELDLGSHKVISINGDHPLKEALLLMHSEGITSLPVLDNHKNVIGNISHVDVKLLTNTSALPLLDSSCIHFITVILSERGMNDGQDSYPVFHVNPTSTLAHTIAKIVATRSHRMWIVDAPSPASSIPPSPHLAPSVTAPPPVLSQLSSTTQGPPYTPATPNVSVPASALPGANLGGHLNGVVSLTDLLNLFARMSGLSPLDPDETRRRRRRSSSHSSMQASVDSFRSSVDIAGSQRRWGLMAFDYLLHSFLLFFWSLLYLSWCTQRWRFSDSRRIFYSGIRWLFLFVVGDWMFQCFDYIYDVFFFCSLAVQCFYGFLQEGGSNLRIEIAWTKQTLFTFLLFSRVWYRDRAIWTHA
jgi:CBS domain-containing protein